MRDPDSLMTSKLLDSLYVEAMVLADEARSYFESGRFAEETGDDPVLSLHFSCESLKVTTRLMHSIAWLLNQKALLAGELSDADSTNFARALGYTVSPDDRSIHAFPDDARSIILASEEFFLRLQRLSVQMDRAAMIQPPVRDMLERLRASF
jgi:regulator of CtrA degradation